LLDKIVVLVALGVCSALITSTVLACFKRDPIGPEGKTITITAGVVNGQAAKQVPAPGPTSFASFTMKQLDIRARGHLLAIAAVAHIRDMRPNVAYVWSVRVLDPNHREKVLFEKRYEDQVFALPPEREMDPTFQDEIEIPLSARTYLVDISAYMVTPEHGLAGLDDTKVADFLRGPSGMKRIAFGR
jgi:hypothetical protein